MSVVTVFAITVFVVASILLFALRRRRTPARPVRGFITLSGHGNSMNNITQGATKTATLNLTDANGVARPLPAGVVPVWTVDNPVVALTPAADGLTCVVVAGTTDGDATLTATTTYADGDAVVVTLAVSVVDPEDTQGTITLA